jgi:hypothetical protein
MGKLAIRAGDFSGVEAAAGFNNYVGPTPPKGLYRWTTKLWRVKTNSAGDQMFMIVFEIDEPPKSKNAKYNGFASFHNANLTEQSAPYVNGLLDALGLSRKAVWTGAGNGVVTSKAAPNDVMKIGTKSVIGIDVMGNAVRKEYPLKSGEFQLEIKTFLPVNADGDDDEDSDESDDDDTDDADPDDDDDSDGDGDDEDDEEPF